MAHLCLQVTLPSEPSGRPADGKVYAELLRLLQLRDLVPPQSKDSSSQDNLDPSKRPKHVVLSDTIQLVRVLQHKVSLSRCLTPLHACPQATHVSIMEF